MISTTAPLAYADSPRKSLVVPLAGNIEGALQKAPVRFTGVLNDLLQELGGVPIEARVERADLAAITGCADDSDECLAQIAEAMDVAEVFSGQIERDRNGALNVLILWFRQGKSVQRITVHIRSPEMLAASHEFADAVRKRLGGQSPTAKAPAADTSAATTGRLLMDTSPKPKREHRGMSLSRVKPYSFAIAGTGVALMTAGAVFYARANGKQSDVDGASTETAADLDLLRDLEQSGRRFNTLGNIGTIVGGVAAATGLTLIVLQSRSSNEKPETAISPTVSSRGAGVVVRWETDFLGRW